jgi:hypothetical protein
MADIVKSQFRWEDVAKTVLRSKRKSVILIAEDLAARYGVLEEIAGGDELYPSETTWYFNAPKRS